MTYSKGSVVVGGEGPEHRCAGFVVVPDGGGEREDALQDADDHARDGVTAVAFQVELSFEGLVDRLDGLAQGLEQPGPGTGRFSFAGGAEQVDAGFAQRAFEVLAVVVL